MPDGHGIRCHRLGVVLLHQEIQGMAFAETEVDQESLDPIRVPYRHLVGDHAGA